MVFDLSVVLVDGDGLHPCDPESFVLNTCPDEVQNDKERKMMSGGDRIMDVEVRVRKDVGGEGRYERWRR